MSEEHPNQQSLPAVPTVGSLTTLSFRSLKRYAAIEACAVSLDDLRRLYVDLDRKTQEAVETHIRPLQRPPGTSEEEWEYLKQHARSIGHLTILVEGGNGERIVANSLEAFRSEALPHSIVSVSLDSAAALGTENVQLANRFNLKLDFREPPGYFSYNPWDQPTPNESYLEVVGPDDTWVTAVYESTMDFFRRKRRHRGWLHSAATFNLLHWVLGFPAALWVVFRFSELLEQEALHTALKGATYVYLFLFALMVFRLLIGLLRWVFPVIELEGSRSTKARGVLTVIVSSLLAALLYDVLKTLLT